MIKRKITTGYCLIYCKLNFAYFNDSNGVRQGGVLSPIRVAIYVDALLVKLNLCKSRCYIIDQ